MDLLYVLLWQSTLLVFTNFTVNEYLLCGQYQMVQAKKFKCVGVPKQRATTAPSSQSECHLAVFCINEIVPDYVVYLVNIELDFGDFSICTT